MKRLLMLTMLLTLFLFAGCGDTNSSSGTQSQVGGTSNSADGYLNDTNQDTQVIFVQWTESNGQLTGSWNAATLQNGSISYENLPITGTHDNNTGSINFVVNFGGTETAISGTLQNNKLQLQMQQNGQFKNLLFHAASNMDYQSTLTQFQARYRSS